MSIPNSGGRTAVLAPDNHAYLATAGRAGAPGIVVIQEAFGVNAFVKATCDRFAARGLNAIAPDYYHGRTFDYADRDNAIAAVNDVNDDVAMKETAAGVDALVAHGARRDAIGVVGFCMGGRLAFLANAALGSKLAATVSFYGGGIAPPEPKGKRKPLLDRVPDLASPALLLYGAKDASIGAEEHARLARALTEANKRYTIAVFPDAPHAFATFDRESYREQAAAQAWRVADDFLAAIFGR
jgi:carboxymethylenebutenolidase